MNISKVKYSRGMLKNTRDRKRTHVVTFVGDEISLDLSKAILENHLLDAGGTYGDPDVGDPIEYDHLVIVHDGGTVDIEFYNKGISLAMGDHERERQIFRVCTMLHRLAEKGK